jgi:pantetheine-phosphate adenylyltransferase
MRRAVYAGSFDPITKGHLWMIERGAALFDELIVAIGENPDKRYTFPHEERQAMLRESVEGIGGVRVESFVGKYLVDYASAIGAQYMLRGIRSGADFDYERAMRHVNQDLQPGIATVFLMPPRDIAEVSSSLVKGLIGPAGWREAVRRYLPDPVYRRILERYADA